MPPAFTFQYPAHVPGDAQARIDRDVEAGDEAFAQALPVQLIVGGPGVRDDPAPARDDDTRDAAALAGLLRVAETIVEALSRVAPREQWPDGTLSSTVDNLVAQRIVWVHTWQSSGTLTLKAFTAQVYAALEARLWWMSLLSRPWTEPTTVAAPVPAPSQDTRPPLTPQGAAKRLGRSVSTIRRMMKNGKLQTVEIGKRHLIPAVEIDRLLATPEFQFPDR
jgi:excisionase family DNA binding protein